MPINTTIKCFVDNIHVILTGDFSTGNIDLNRLTNLALYRIAHKEAFGKRIKLPALTPEEKDALKLFWKNYCIFKSDKYHRLYKQMTGNFFPEYIPEDVMWMYVDRYLSDRKESAIADNKCDYYEIFKGLSMPIAYALRKNEVWTNPQGDLLSSQEVLDIIRSHEEVVIKKATDSECGMGVFFVRGKDITDDDFANYLSIDTDLVIQEVVKQHPVLSKPHPSSVNCYRIDTYVLDGKANFASCDLKIGGADSRTDNTHQNGANIAINQDGEIMDLVYSDIYTCVDEIPGLNAGMNAPGFHDAVRLCLEAHLRVPQFRFIGWDIAITEDETPTIIEANFSLSGIRYDQNCSPLFGTNTRAILDEVFKGRRKLFL